MTEADRQLYSLQLTEQANVLHDSFATFEQQWNIAVCCCVHTFTYPTANAKRQQQDASCQSTSSRLMETGCARPDLRILDEQTRIPT